MGRATSYSVNNSRISSSMNTSMRPRPSFTPHPVDCAAADYLQKPFREAAEVGFQISILLLVLERECRADALSL